MSTNHKIEFVPAAPKFAETWLKWREEKGAVLYNPLNEMTKSEIAERLSREAGGFEKFTDKNELRWFALKEGEPVGSIGVDKINLKMKSASFGYQVGENYSGQGLGTLLVREFVQLLFEKTEIERLTATVHFEHKASQRILEKVGFTQEGLLRKYLIMNDQRVDFYGYSILRDDPIK